MDRYQQQWENLGSHDPYWAVLSDPARKGGKWDKAEFFETGRREIERIVTRLAEKGVPSNFALAVDFGCGVGRLSRALSEHFENVVGIDISESMLAEARAQHRDFTNIRFVHNVAPDLGLIPDSTVDLIYSDIVLQHMPASRQRQFISEFCRVLRPGGVAVFQTPSHLNLTRVRTWAHLIMGNRLLNMVRRVLHGKHGVMEMHPLARNAVLDELQKRDMSMLDVERYDAAGPDFVSFRYYALKPARQE